MTGLLEPDLLPCGYVVLAEDGQLMQANAAFLEMLGLPDPLTTKVNFNQLLSVPSRIFYSAQIATALKVQTSMQEVALDLLHSSGKRVPVLVNARLVRPNPEVPALLYMAVFGAPERRRYESEIMDARKRAERIAEVVHRSSDAILLISPAGIIEAWNPGAERIFGHNEDEVLNRSFVKLLLPADMRSHASESILELATGKVVTIETVALHKKGHQIEVSIHFSPHIDPPGLLTSFSAVIRDITSRKLSERALLQNEKLAAVGRLASSIAHEINNPLEAVTNLLYIARTTADLPEAIRETLDQADQELGRVALITNQTLRFHRQSTRPQEITCLTLFSTVLAMYEPKIRNLGLRVEKRKRANRPVRIFEGDIRQVLNNIIGNAIDAMKTGERLLVRSREGTRWSTGETGLVLTIGDTGPGMSPEVAGRIFEPFYTTKGDAGSGLGLWISKEIVDRHHGSLRMRSSQSDPSHGTVFTLFLPFDSPSIKDPVRASALPVPL